LDLYQSDWLTGAQAALNTYEESAHDIASQVQGVFTDAFTGLEDVFVQFATTGKITFKNFADSVIGDIARIIAKEEISSIAKLFSFGAGGSSAISDLGLTGSTVRYAAAGGSISGPTVVGEKGPELFVPDTSGYIVPNNKLGGAFGVGAPVIQFSPTYHIGSGVDRAQVLAAMAQTQQSTIAQMSNLINGGAYRR
jgi:lambda family phage tail tape measure protein